MKVKIGDTIHDGEKEMVMVILEPKDKENIANMLPECTKYCQFPYTEDLTEEQVDKFMEI